MFNWVKKIFSGKRKGIEVHSSELEFQSLLKPRSELQAKSSPSKGAFHSASLVFREFHDLPDEEHYQILAGRNLLSVKKLSLKS